LISCIDKYTALGITPGAVLTQCNKKTLVACIKRVPGLSYVANSVSEGKDGYLVDLGNDENRWIDQPEIQQLYLHLAME